MVELEHTLVAYVTMGGSWWPYYVTSTTVLNGAYYLAGSTDKYQVLWRRNSETFLLFSELLTGNYTRVSKYSA
jgi:hypothetical protein